MPSEDHKQLIKTLNKLVKQERWQKFPKAQGTVLEKLTTKSGNIKLVLDEGTKFYVLKKNKNLFEKAQSVQTNDRISAAFRMQLGKKYCVKLAKKEKDLSDFFRDA